MFTIRWQLNFLNRTKNSKIFCWWSKGAWGMKTSNYYCQNILMTLRISDLTTTETQYYLQHLIAPRPIALASTIDEEGNVNLSPFSFFNLFSNNPPIVIFSPARRLRNNTTKHTLDNLRN